MHNNDLLFLEQQKYKTLLDKLWNLFLHKDILKQIRSHLVTHNNSLIPNWKKNQTTKSTLKENKKFKKDLNFIVK